MATTPVDFSDLGGVQVTPPPSAPSGGGIDFSDLGGQKVSGATAGTPIAGSAAGDATMSSNTPITSGGKIAQWAQNVQDDIKNGTDVTGVGTVLKKLGAHGVNVGNPNSVGEFMASLPLGLLRTAKGTGEASDVYNLNPNGAGPAQAAKDIVGGVSQAATMPSAVFAPESAEAAPAIAEKLVDAAGHLIPDAQHAGQAFQAVSKAVGDHPVEVTNDLSTSLMRYIQLAENGNGRSPGVQKLFARLTSPDKGPLTFDDARDFYSALGRLTANEKMSLSPVMQRQVGQVWNDLGDAIGQTADRGGQLPKFQGAMQEYRSLMNWRGAKDAAWELAKKAAVASIPGAAAAYGIKKVVYPSAGQ